ncbi:MAG TPA: hypothetical protein ENH99_02790 [Candidatus Pacearchaeota archaeon]|nr:hypothetical protein [Candidatus Pacearchaeota archaeon]
MKKKYILDVTCGTRSIWKNKNHPAVLYCDIRKEPKGFIKEKPNLEVCPDKIIDFRNLPFPDRSFKLIVFDPPQMKEGKAGKGCMLKMYGSLDRNSWESDLKKGFDECWRVLQDYGILIFKWNEISIKKEKVFELFDVRPLFGHVTNKSSKNTIWATYMKIPKSES